MSNTAVGLFKNSVVACQVVHDINVSAFPRTEIHVLQEPLDMPVDGVMSVPHTDFQVRFVSSYQQYVKAKTIQHGRNLTADGYNTTSICRPQSAKQWGELS